MRRTEIQEYKKAIDKSASRSFRPGGSSDPIQDNLQREKRNNENRGKHVPPSETCPVHGDPIVAYCVDTREYLGLKRVIEFSQKHPKYQLKSLMEMKEMMKELIEESVG